MNEVIKNMEERRSVRGIQTGYDQKRGSGYDH